MKSMEEWLTVYQGGIEDYEKKHPHWRIEVLVSLIKWGLRCLKHYIEQPGQRKITWDDPFVKVNYGVDWNWELRSNDDITKDGRTFGKITKENTATEEIAVRTLSEIMTRQFNVMTLAELTNWAYYEIVKNRYTPVLPVEISAELSLIKNKQARKKAFDDAMRPFAIGGDYVDYSSMEMRDGEPVSKEVAMQLEDVDTVPRVDFNGDVNGQKFTMSLVFVIEPLTVDYNERKAYHSITVGLAFYPEEKAGGITAFKPANWPASDQQEFWEGLLKKIDEIATGLIPKPEAEESVILSVNSQLKVPADCWKPENRSATIKQIADLQSAAGELQGFSVELAGLLGRQQLTGSCGVCGWVHDQAFTQMVRTGAGPITLSGILPDIVRLVHQAHEKGLAGLSTKDETLVRICGGYRHPCKAFDNLKQSTSYKLIFDTRRRGSISIRGAVGKRSE